MASSPPKKLDVDGTELELAVERKRVKNVNARLRGSRLLVSAPAGMADEELDPVVSGLARRLLRRPRQADRRGRGSALVGARGRR